MGIRRSAAEVHDRLGKILTIGGGRLILFAPNKLWRDGMKIAWAAFALLAAASPALAQNVKITPIGSHPGELCANDRAIIFEDPTGVRFLYDAAQNVTGGNDPRLGTIHLVLLSHMHGD